MNCEYCGGIKYSCGCGMGEPDSLQRLVSLPGQPLCKHYTGASLNNLTGDYSCRCLAGKPYELWTPDMERWPCRRRHILGLEQHKCEAAEYGHELTDSVDAQITEMARRAVGQANNQAHPTAAGGTGRAERKHGN